MEINLKNQISLVTGATGKIGGSIALQLAKWFRCCNSL